jgi:hypothetical protein
LIRKKFCRKEQHFGVISSSDFDSDRYFLQGKMRLLRCHKL